MNARAFRAEMATAGKSIDRFGNQTVSAQKRMMAGARGLRQIGGAMTRHMTVPIVAAGVASAKFATDFRAEMELIHTQANLSEKQVGKLSSSVLAMKNTAQGPMELAKGLYHLVSIGLTAQQGMQAMRVASDLAAVGHANLEGTASALSAALLVNKKRFGQNEDVTKDFSKTAAVLNATIGTGRLRMDELTNALGSGILPVAKEAGLKITDVMGVLALLTDEGFDASSAMRLLRTSLSFFTAPTEKAKKTMEGLGLTWHALGDELQKPRGLLRALKLLDKHLPKDAKGRLTARGRAALGAILPAGRGVPIRVLLNQIDRYGVKLDTITKKQGDFTDSVTKTRKTGWFKLREAWSQIQKAAVRLGDVLAPVLVKLAGWATKMADAFQRLSPGEKKFVVWVLAAVAVTGPLLIALGTLATSILAIGTAIRWVRGSGSLFSVLGGPKGAGTATKVGTGLGSTLGRAFVGGTAAFVAGWTIGKVLRDKVPAVRKAGDWIGGELGKAIFGQVNQQAEKAADSAFWLMQNKLRVIDMKFKAHLISWPEWWLERMKITGPGAAQLRAFGVDLTPQGLHNLKIGGSVPRPEVSVGPSTHGRRPRFHNIPHLRHRQFGGTVSATAEYLVGERGPERIKLPAGARVTPWTAALQAQAAGTDGGGEQHIHLYIDGREVNTATTRVEKRKEARR